MAKKLLCCYILGDKSEVLLWPNGTCQKVGLTFAAIMFAECLGVAECLGPGGRSSVETQSEQGIVLSLAHVKDTKNHISD